MVKGGPPRRWTRVHREATAQPDATVPRPENAATNQPKKTTTRTHSHRLAPTWCGAGEVLGEGWRCGCNPRSCRAVVEKSGQRPPVGARYLSPGINLGTTISPCRACFPGTPGGHQTHRCVQETYIYIHIYIYMYIYVYMCMYVI